MIRSRRLWRFKEKHIVIMSSVAIFLLIVRTKIMHSSLPIDVEENAAGIDYHLPLANASDVNYKEEIQKEHVESIESNKKEKKVKKKKKKVDRSKRKKLSDSKSKGAHIITTTDGEDPDPEIRDRRNFIKKMMEHAWNGYRKYAWGSNELAPISMEPTESSMFGDAPMASTILDSLDTLYIMGMTEEFQDARKWIKENFKPEKMTGTVSVFETVIRVVGGLLSIYSLTGDKLFLDKAHQMSLKLLPAFDETTGFTKTLIDLESGKSNSWSHAYILSEVGTFQMEFNYLSDLTGNQIFASFSRKAQKSIASIPRSNGLFFNFISGSPPFWLHNKASLGAYGDSFYEYLLKEWLRSGRTDKLAFELFEEAAGSIDLILKRVSNAGLVYVGDYSYGHVSQEMQHLSCFAGGLFALAAVELSKTKLNKDDDYSDKETIQRWLDIGGDITDTCRESYKVTPTHLGPDVMTFGKDGMPKSADGSYKLRPETVESYFYMWRITKDPKYREWGWEAAQAMEKYCKVNAGYSGLRYVNSIPPYHDDVMQSFFLAETLKYLYLLFSDDSLISLDQWVFNTEAHPLPIKGSNRFYRANKKPVH